MSRGVFFRLFSADVVLYFAVAQGYGEWALPQCDRAAVLNDLAVGSVG